MTVVCVSCNMSVKEPQLSVVYMPCWVIIGTGRQFVTHNITRQLAKWDVISYYRMVLDRHNRASNFTNLMIHICMNSTDTWYN